MRRSARPSPAAAGLLDGNDDHTLDGCRAVRFTIVVHSTADVESRRQVLSRPARRRLICCLHMGP